MSELLITTLDELITLQERLIQIADRKKNVLMERKVDELNQLTEEEIKLVKQLEQLERKRQQEVDNLIQDHPTLTFQTFVERLEDSSLKARLQSKISILQELMQELQTKNKINEQLLKDSLHFVQHIIEQVTQSKQQQFNYQSPLHQHKSQTSSQGFFDTKA